MRLAGFGGISILLLILAALHLLSFDPRPALAIFISLITLTTALGIFYKNARTSRYIFFILLLDTICISMVLYLSGNVFSSLSFLYLIGLISASLLSRWAVVSLGIFSFFNFGLISYLNLSYGGALGPDQITQIAVFVLLAALAACQGYLFLYLVKSKDEKVQKIKDDFIFTTAHDLRAPFSLIRLLAEKYEKKHPETLEELKDDMEAISANISSVTRVLEDLLLLTKGENVVLQAVPVDLSDMIKTLIDHWSFAMSKKDVRILYEAIEPDTVLGDRQKLGFVFDNLISNSIKYNKRGGAVRIWHEVHDNFLDTIIQDTGYGISPENLFKIFSPYFREQKDKEIPGTGLGLYSAKKFVEQMKGKISVASLSDGTKFTVSLPMTKTG